VVEDQGKVARVAERILTSHGFKTRVVNSVAETYAVLDDPDAKYDLIFCDVVLGDGNGVELAETISAQNPGMRFLFASGYVDERSRWASIKQHGWKCLIKPYPASDLLAAVNEALAFHPDV
jgi:DNA-binding NtrC family response regulator